MLTWKWHVPDCTVKRKGAGAESRSDDHIFPVETGTFPIQSNGYYHIFILHCEMKIQR